MEIHIELESLNFKERCIKHPDQIIEYIRINYSKQSQPFFCCMFCINEDKSIKLDDYQSIKYIIKSNHNEIIPEWPPIQNKKIIEQIIEKKQIKEDSNNNIVEQVKDFFSEFKKSIVESIDEYELKMMKQAQIIQEQMSQNHIIKQYQEISKIQQLKKELLNHNSTIVQKENICKELIQQSQSEQNTLKLQNLLNNISQNIIFDHQSSQFQQQSILNSINNINLFKSIPLQQQQQQNHEGYVDIKLLKTNFQDGQNSLEIIQNNNNQIQVTNVKNNFYYNNVISDIILDQNTKYTFRFQIDNLLNGNYIFLGLISDDNKDIQQGFQENLCCCLQKMNNSISKIGYYGIDKQLKGDKFQLSEEKQIEMRIHIQENILELVDFPNYSNKISLIEKHIPNLINAKDLRVYLGLRYNNNSITLINSQIVKNFQ